MGLQMNIWTEAGEERECYVRMNSIEANNHGAASTALFRAFLSKDAYERGGKFVGEWEVSFVLDSVSGNLWDQSYAAFGKHIAALEAAASETGEEPEVAYEVSEAEPEDLTEIGSAIDARNADLMLERRRVFLAEDEK